MNTPRVPAHLRESPEHGRHRRGAQQRPPGQREVHGVDPPDMAEEGSSAEPAKGACEARPQRMQGEPGRVGEEGVVLVGLEVLVFDPLELDVVRQVAAGPADLFGSQRLQRSGGGTAMPGAQSQPKRTMASRMQSKFSLASYRHLCPTRRPPGVEVLERQGHQRDAVRLAQGRPRLRTASDAVPRALPSRFVVISPPSAAATVVQSAAIARAAAASRPQPSAPA